MNLALRYRPSSFDDLVGQEVLVRILRNSFSMGSISSPILMVGSSGVGKTTCARIVSLCLNCLKGPTPDPCGVCECCISVKDSSNPDVVEIDAASNTGVDDIRIILENSRYVPTYCRFKVYIIDEVHMLSISAFNALLKTLEDPAEHVRFIMATTEVRKVPVTVISRCQRLDFLKLSVEQLFNHLVKISEKEGINHDSESLTLIAENASGSVRNSLFLLEQAFIYTQNNISAEYTRVLLGCIDRKCREDIVCYILLGDAVKAVYLFRDLCSKSTVISIFEGIKLVIYELCLFSVSSEFKTELGSLVRSTERSKSTSFLCRIWQVLIGGINEIKSSDYAQQSGEMLIIKMCYLSDLPSPEKIARIIFSSGESSPLGVSGGRGSSPNIRGRIGVLSSTEELSDSEISSFSSGEEDSGDGSIFGKNKKSDADTSDTVYNPEEDVAVMGVVRDFEGASIVGVRALDG